MNYPIVKHEGAENGEAQLAKFGIKMDEVYFQDGEMWLTLEQIGTGLGYANAKWGANNLFQRYRKDLERYSTVLKLSTVTGERETRLFNSKGVTMFAIKSNTAQACEFQHVIVRIVDDVRKKEYIHRDIVSIVTYHIGHKSMENFCSRSTTMTPEKFYLLKNRYLPMGLTHKECAKLLGTTEGAIGGALRAEKRGRESIWSKHHVPHAARLFGYQYQKGGRVVHAHN